MTPARTQEAPAASPPRPGESVAGYRIERVRPGEDPRWTMTDATAPDGRAVRLAVSTRAAAEHAQVRERVRRLGRLTEMAEPPLLAPIAAGRCDERLYVVLAPDDEPTLADRLRDGPLTCDEAVGLLTQVADGLETLRAVGLPARILTPRQIVLRSGEPTRALLSGYAFGRPPARAYERLGTAEQADYLAPEVAAGAPADTAAAVYALACVLVECLSGRPPFPEDRPLLVLRAHATKRPPRVSSLADVPPALDAVVIAALSKQPDRRPPSAVAFMRAVGHAAGARRPSPMASTLEEATVAAPAIPRRAARRPAPPRGRPAAPSPGPRRPTSASPAPHRPVPAARRRAAWPVTSRTSVAVGLAALAAATAGFAVAGLHGGRSAPPSAASASVSPANAAGGAPRGYLRSLDGTLARLSAERVDGRHRLQLAPSARAQISAAVALGETYREAQRALPPAPASLGAARALATVLKATATDYDRLASAVEQGDLVGYEAVSDELVQDEQSLQQQLHALA